MGTILASAIINKTAVLLYDVINIKWSRLELLGWLNDAQRAVVIQDPSANNLTKAIQMAGGTRQSIPADGWTLLDVYRNMGTSGTIPGRALRIVEKKALDAFNPNWHFATTSQVVREYCFDGNDQTKFWVSPPSDGTGWIEVNYSQVPADLALETAAITLNDVFEPMLIDYMMYRAYSKTGDLGNPDLAEKHWSAYDGQMKTKLGAQTGSDPNGMIAKPAPPGAPQ